MPIQPSKDLLAALPRDRRVLGLDLGTKTIGLALSDLTRVVASPHSTIKRTKFTKDAQALLAIVDQFDVGALILGLPVSLDGSEGPRCQSTRQFAANLDSLRPIPMAFWDERLSTVAVTRVLLDADASRARRAELVDKMAASYILQGALDAARSAVL